MLPMTLSKGLKVRKSRELSVVPIFKQYTMNENQKIIAAVKSFIQSNELNPNTKKGFLSELSFVAGYFSALIPDPENISEELNHTWGFIAMIHGAGRSLSTL
jgi:hypothetical protein